MSQNLKTEFGLSALKYIIPKLRAALVEFNNSHFPRGQELISEIGSDLASVEAKSAPLGEDSLNDLFVVKRYVRFLSVYGTLWDKIVKYEFSASWNDLQDALDLLRLIKRFSSINVSFFENQLLELEQAYPYNVFFSVGMTVEYIECGICGKDINSLECEHIRGNLYMGELANGVYRNVVSLDHASLVADPEDKRCVISYKDNGPHFRVVRYLSQMITSDANRILTFNRLEHSKRIISRQQFPKIGRNATCFCGSRKKFKKCCWLLPQAEIDHTEIIATPIDVEKVVPEIE